MRGRLPSCVSRGSPAFNPANRAGRVCNRGDRAFSRGGRRRGRPNREFNPGSRVGKALRTCWGNSPWLKKARPIEIVNDRVAHRRRRPDRPKVRRPEGQSA
jgi:hypothetical protein